MSRVDPGKFETEKLQIERLMIATTARMAEKWYEENFQNRNRAFP